MAMHTSWGGLDIFISAWPMNDVLNEQKPYKRLAEASGFSV